MAKPEIKEVTEDIEIINKMGIHARPAAKIAQTCENFLSEIYIEKDGNKINAKSILGIMTLGAPCGSKLKLIAYGPDANNAVTELKNLFLSKFGEE